MDETPESVDYDYYEDEDDRDSVSASKVAAVAGVGALLGAGAVIAGRKLKEIWTRRTTPPSQEEVEAIEVANSVVPTDDNKE